MSDSRVLIGYFVSCARISFIGLLRSIFTTSPPSFVVVDLRQILRRIVLELLEEHAVPGDLAERLAVGRARHAEPDRQRRAVARQPDHAHVVAEILAAELRADAERLRHLEHLLLHREIAEGVAVLASPCVGRLSRYLVEASFTVFIVSSAEVPPITIAR